MTARIFLRLLLALVGLLAITALGLFYLVTGAAERNLRQNLETSLAGKARLAALLAQQSGEGQYANLAERIAAEAEARVTIIGHEGTVLADSEMDAAAMENQASRPEFAAAL